MPWFRFWKRWRNGANNETYRHYSERPDENTLRLDSEDWADSVSGGEVYGFKWGWEDVEHPPEEWLKEEVSRSTQRSESYEGRAAFLQSVLDEIA
jgi:hypothetical protein